MYLKPRLLNIGSVEVGGNSPVSVQTMTNTPTTDIDATLAQITKCADAGCDIIRVAIPDHDSASSLREIKDNSPLPLVADIHFDYRLAILAIENGVDAIRINPGNIAVADGKNRVGQIVDAAQKAHIPIRVGVNAGSLDKDLLDKYKRPIPKALVASAIRQCQMLERFNFHDIKVSIKSSTVTDTVAACRLFQQESMNIAKRTGRAPYPQHIGVTETGTMEDGIIKSAVGIGALLLDGIGSTIRVSLTADPVEEVIAGIKILEACGMRRPQVEVISCPTCARTEVDLSVLAASIKQKIIQMRLPKPLRVAVMGCMVNGPGEAREADIGIAWGKNKAVVFRNGKPVQNIPTDQAEQCLIDFIRKIHI